MSQKDQGEVERMHTGETVANRPVVFAISGPSGAGKDYLQDQLVHSLGAVRVPMVTNRPARPEGEEKICITGEEYDELERSGRLVGSHTNDLGFKYGFRASDLAGAGHPIVVIELNPAHQAEVPEQLSELGFHFGGWFGLVAADEYIAYNMNRRQVMAPAELANRLRMAHIIGDAIQRLAQDGVVIPFPVGMENRPTMGADLSEMVRERVDAIAAQVTA